MIFDKSKISSDAALEISNHLRRFQKDIDDFGLLMDKHGITISSENVEDMSLFKSATLRVSKLAGRDDLFVVFALLPVVKSSLTKLSSELEPLRVVEVKQDADLNLDKYR